MRGLKGRSGGARLRARFELQVPREPGVLAAAHGPGVRPPVAAGRAALPARLRSSGAAIARNAAPAAKPRQRLPAVALLLLHLLRGGVELILPLLHDLLAILLREQVAADGRLRRTAGGPGRLRSTAGRRGLIVQAPGRHEVPPPLQQRC